MEIEIPGTIENKKVTEKHVYYLYQSQSAHKDTESSIFEVIIIVTLLRNKIMGNLIRIDFVPVSEVYGEKKMKAKTLGNPDNSRYS